MRRRRFPRKKVVAIAKRRERVYKWAAERAFLRKKEEWRSIWLIFSWKKSEWSEVHSDVGAGEGFEPPTSGLWARRATKLLYPALFNWCRRPGSNRYGIKVPQDFKSWASASSATPASFARTASPLKPYYNNTFLLFCQELFYDFLKHF